jgi:phosphatidylinositol phosphate synthase
MLDQRWRARVEHGLDPIGRSLARSKVNADVLTVIGLGFSIATAFLIASGRLGLAVVGVLLTGVPDILDGSVARHSGKAGPRGAFFDSVCDRVSDAVLLGGVAWYLAGEGSHLPLLAFAAVALSMLISYERAKAEGLAFSARGGLMERAERLVLLGIGLAFDVLIPVLWIMVALMAVTAVHRFVKVWNQASEAIPRTRPVRPRRLRHARTRPGDGLEPVSAPAPRRFAEWWASRQPSPTRRARRRTGP